MFKWIGIVVGSLLGLIILVVGTLAIIGGSKLNQQYDVQPEPVAISDDTAVLQRGQYLVSVSCAGCHGENLAGKPFVDDPALGFIPASNLTAGQGGAGATFSDADFVRAIRHGIDNEGKPLAIMPSRAYWHFSDEDLGAIIAYVQSLPPVDNEMGEKNLKLMGRLLLGAGALDILAAESIDHAGARPAAQAQRVDSVYGEYLANTGDCQNCHGPDLSGAPPAEPGGLPGPDITPGGHVADWTTNEFITAMRTGRTPGGQTLNPEFMPWESYGRLTDDDLTALFLYLQSLETAVSSKE
jgi:mono/diheme cytochrome c family protein